MKIAESVRHSETLEQQTSDSFTDVQRRCDVFRKIDNIVPRIVGVTTGACFFFLRVVYFHALITRAYRVWCRRDYSREKTTLARSLFPLVETVGGRKSDIG